MLTGLSASVVRASVMGCLVIFALFQGRKSDGLQMLLVSGFLMVLLNPMILLGDVSFQLSFLSTLGLLVLLPLWEDFFNRLPPIISESLAVTLAATVFTLPIVLYNFGRFSLISPLANIIFLPLIPLIMVTSFFALIGSIIFYPLSILFVGVCTVFLFLLIEGVGLIAELPFAMVEIPLFSEWMMLIYFMILWWIINFFRKSRLEQVSVRGRF
jgi:competence protein ComEC